MLVANNVQKFRWPAKSLNLNPIDHLLDLLKRKVRAQPLHLNISGSSRVLFIRCVRSFHNSTFIDTFYQWEHCLSGGCSKYWNKIKYV